MSVGARTPSGVIWMTGLSGAGKTTLASALRERVIARGVACVLLDGDALRAGLCRDLGFSPEDRSEHARRVSALCCLLRDSGALTIVALISPHLEDRARARADIGALAFMEVYVDAALATCRARDVKGIYARHDRGELSQLTGVDFPYEPPREPALHLRTDRHTITECVDALDAAIIARGWA